MKTLVLLSAIVLLAFQVQADPIQQTDEEAKTEEQPGEEEQGMSVFFDGPKVSALQDAAPGRTLKCHCALYSCKYPTTRRGICLYSNSRYGIFCCS